MKIWILCTTVPNDPEPCWPQVFTSEAAADAAFETAMRGEWEAAGIEDEHGNKLPFPGDPEEAHDQIKDHYLYCGSELWGQWEITAHEIDVKAGDAIKSNTTFIPVNEHGVKPGYYTRPDIVRLLRLHCEDAPAVHFIADMME